MKLPEFKVEIVPLSAAAQRLVGFEWADAQVGSRSKIGGEPDTLQVSQAPACEGCDQPMTFFSQLDSIGDGLVFADVGMLLTYVCFDCDEATSFVNSG